MIQSLAIMSTYPIHRNLNTTFVDLSALVRHLRGLQFAGSIDIELGNYEAEIELSSDGSITAREQDHIAGRISFGEDALGRIMIRSREPGGVINVYRSDNNKGGPEVFIDEVIAAHARRTAAPHIAKLTARRKGILETAARDRASGDAPIPKPDHALRNDDLESWTELLSLVTELMKTIEGALAKGNIDFADAFGNACGFASFDHPFLDPDTDVFSYEDGFLKLRRRIPAPELIAGVTAALARMMERLREDPYFGSTYHLTTHRVRVLVNRHRLQFDRHGLSRELKKMIAI
ncbi:MAG: hypothetical protein IPM25_10935 [Chloracidobacterium sp.]|nr:hypothetical protein [Chloracidobacterium sp.]